MTTPDAKPTFAQSLDELLRDAYDKFAADERILHSGGGRFAQDTSTADVEVVKAGAYIQVSCCILTDSTGVNHCDHPAPPRPPLHRRLRWRLSSKWSALRMRVGSWIAGVDLDDREDW